MRQSVIASRVGLNHAAVKRILLGGDATGTLVPGMSMGAFQKTTPRQNCALLRMVREYRFISARAMTAQIRNSYRIRAARKTIKNRLLSRSYHAFKFARKTLLIDNHCLFRLEWGQRWHNLTMAHWQHVISGEESKFQLYPVDGRLRICCLPGDRFQQRCQAYRVQAGGGSVHVWGVVHGGAKLPLVIPDR